MSRGQVWKDGNGYGGENLNARIQTVVIMSGGNDIKANRSRVASCKILDAVSMHLPGAEVYAITETTSVSNTK